MFYRERTKEKRRNKVVWETREDGERGGEENIELKKKILGIWQRPKKKNSDTETFKKVISIESLFRELFFF